MEPLDRAARTCTGIRNNRNNRFKPRACAAPPQSSLRRRHAGGGLRGRWRVVGKEVNMVQNLSAWPLKAISTRGTAKHKGRSCQGLLGGGGGGLDLELRDALVLLPQLQMQLRDGGGALVRVLERWQIWQASAIQSAASGPLSPGDLCSPSRRSRTSLSNATTPQLCAPEARGRLAPVSAAAACPPAPASPALVHPSHPSAATAARRRSSSRRRCPRESTQARRCCQTPALPLRYWRRGSRCRLPK